MLLVAEAVCSFGTIGHDQATMMVLLWLHMDLSLRACHEADEPLRSLVCSMRRTASGRTAMAKAFSEQSFD